MTADRRVVTLGQVLQIFAFSLQQSLLHLRLMILVVDVVDGMCCERRGNGNEVKGQDEWPLAHFSATLVQNFTSDFRRHRLRARSVPFSRPVLPPAHSPPTLPPLLSRVNHCCGSPLHEHMSMIAGGTIGSEHGNKWHKLTQSDARYRLLAAIAYRLHAT